MENTAAHTGMNKLLLVTALLLICIGVPIIYTASAHFAVSKGFPAEYYLQKHLIKVVGGLVLMFIFARLVDYGHWSWLGRVTFVVGVVLTIAALVAGHGVKGANRWIYGIQPSEIMKLGMYISLGGTVTFKNARVPVEVAAAVPLDRLLLETDAPYLAPVPCRGQVNTPLLISHTYAFIAGARGVSVEQLCRTVDENCRALFQV